MVVAEMAVDLFRIGRALHDNNNNGSGVWTSDNNDVGDGNVEIYDRRRIARMVFLISRYYCP
jgi:hypothetical protein